MGAHFKRNWYWYLVIALLSAGNIYFYSGKKWSEQQAKNKLEEAEIACNDKIATITEHNHVEEIKRQSAFYESLVRDPIYRKSWSELRDQLENIVRETMITQVDYVGTDGKIEISTNTRVEGDNAGENLPAILFSQDAVVHVHKTSQGYLLSVPVYHQSVFLGRLLMQHSLLTANVGPR
jgi:hypothetical protein